VTQLGDVLAEIAQGRQRSDAITIFDSTGLAIQDLAIALAALEHADDLDLAKLEVQSAASRRVRRARSS
jgi:ornithine cyclodeaminase/alanine dehydrogenase-like protein (mu-crystallin family)